MKRSKEEKDRDRAQIAALLEQGQSAEQIAAVVNLPLKQVKSDIKVLQTGSDRRSPEQQLIDRAQIADLRARGKSETFIAKEMNLSVSVICREFVKIDAKWKAAIEAPILQQRAQIAAELGMIYTTAMDEYEASKKPRTKSKQKGHYEKVNGKPTWFPEGDAEHQTEVRNGDPRYLKIAADAKAELAKLTGVSAPVKVEHSGEDGKPIPIAVIQMDPNEL